MPYGQTRTDEVEAAVIAFLIAALAGSAWIPNFNYGMGALVFDGANIQTPTGPGAAGEDEPEWNASLGKITLGDGSIPGWVNLGARVQDVAALTIEDLDKADNLVTRPPAIRTVFDKEIFEQMSDQEFLDYVSAQEYVALVGAERPATVAIERAAAQGFLEVTKNILAGARISLPSNPDGAVILLRSAELFQMRKNGTWYAIRFSVHSFTEFTANIGMIR